MLKVNTYNQTGESTGTVDVSEKIFGVKEVKEGVIHQVINSMLSNKRNTVAATKTRGMVRGGGRKPWKQKGTGRARHGSIRSPLWKGGGVTFGPTSARNFYKKINKKQKSLVFRGILSARFAEDKLVILDTLEAAQGKTKELARTLKILSDKLKFGRATLVILPKMQDSLARAARNLPEVKLVSAINLNILDIISSDTIVATKDALPVIEKTYSK